MTGIGSYFYIMWGIWMRHCLLGRHDMYELVWPNLVFSIPVVNLVDPKKREAEMNGEAKKSR